MRKEEKIKTPRGGGIPQGGIVGGMAKYFPYDINLQI
jgi:hypothetical protein